MSNKFTGITSAGSAIPVYDKDAHEALSSKLDTAVYSAASGNFLTAIPDEYAKTSAVEDMVSAASADLNTAIGNKLDTSSFADVSGSFLTEVPESAVSGFATHDEVESATSGFMQTSGLEYDGDKISGYMGSAFKAGDELPSGVMVESAVGYNAVNEISGYNGSAIAQYGAEKQWLVHDDTLVHASNSAQYALGVNLSAVAQLLGVDETVLWSGNTGSNSHTTAFTLSESFSSFKRIRFEGLQYAGSTPIFEISTPDNLNRVGVCFEYYTFADDSNPYQIRGGSYSATNGLDFTLYKEKFLYWSNTGLSANGGNNTQGPNIRRIIGIGRKA